MWAEVFLGNGLSLYTGKETTNFDILKRKLDSMVESAFVYAPDE